MQLRSEFRTHPAQALRAWLDDLPLARKLRRMLAHPRAPRRRDHQADFLVAALNDLRDEAALGHVNPADIARLRALLKEYRLAWSNRPADTALASPAVSISMASRNRAHCIGDAIRSVQAQSFGDWELIVIDDGSTDATRDVVAGFGDDRRVRYKYQPHAGLAVARNHSLRLAKGSLVAYLDDDNLFYPGFLAAAVGAFSRDPGIDCLYGALVTESHLAGGLQVLFQQFDRERLLAGNSIDMGVLVHRRSLAERYGGIDESIECYCDWDFVLRVTRDKPAMALPVLSTRYRVMDERRMTAKRPMGVDYLRIKRKWFAAPAVPRMPRVLYVAGDESALRRSFVRTQLRCMRAWGVDLTMWCGAEERQMPEALHTAARDSLAETIAASEPDVIHVHGLEAAGQHFATLANAKTPVTVWAAETPLADPRCQHLLAQPWVRRIYFHSDPATAEAQSGKCRALNAAFDTSAFRPSASKERRLVVQISDASTKDQAASFFDIAARCPGHRFVMAIAPNCWPNKIDDVAKLHRDAPGELLVDASPSELLSLRERAGIYLQTAGSETDRASATGIAEAMATGAYILVPDQATPDAAIGNAGQTYRDVAHAAALINQSAAWSDEEWHLAWLRSVDWSFPRFADELVLRPLFDDWCGVLRRE